jgi:hypothetical protein
LFLLRVLGLLVLIAIGASPLLYFVTGNRKYLSVAIRITRYAVVAALAVFALFVLERLAVIA